jgi:hypothetical protein
MSQDGFDSPEVAAMSTFPAEYVYVVAARIQGDEAYVLLNTGSRDQPYLYGVNCCREAGRWYEGGAANGPGWQQTGHDPDVGTLSMWDDVPAGSTRVRIEFNEEVIEEPVTAPFSNQDSTFSIGDARLAPETQDVPRT